MAEDTYVALLRGINVGGKNKLPMRSLTDIFETLGCRAVRSYIQSGNVVFRTQDATGLAAAVTAAIAAEFSLTIPIVLRSAAEMTAAVAGNPFLTAGVAEDTLHAYFLADRPADAAIAGLDLNRSPGDTFAVVGREIYLHLPNGTARTRLTNAYFDKALGTVSTLRNWRTVKVLAEMALHPRTTVAT